MDQHQLPLAARHPFFKEQPPKNGILYTNGLQKKEN
jgi:hypothetical protein